MYVMRPDLALARMAMPSYSCCAARMVRWVVKPSWLAAAICSDEVMNGASGRELVRLVPNDPDAVARRRVEGAG